jgi:hypothetical protein
MTRIHNPWLLIFGVGWVVFCAMPIPIVNKRTHEPISWKDRVLFSLIGFVVILAWYSVH